MVNPITLRKNSNAIFSLLKYLKLRKSLSMNFADKEAKLHQEIMDDPEIKEIKQKAKKKKSVHGSR